MAASSRPSPARAGSGGAAFDESTRLLAAALVTLTIDAQGERLRLELRYRLRAANRPVRIPRPGA